MTRIIGLFTFSLLLIGLSGCSYLFYPNAKEFTAKAKGTTNVGTLMNLATMMDASANASKGGAGLDQPFDDLHNQLHAFNDLLCCLDKTQRETPAYALTITHTKELWAIFKRLWHLKDDQPQRDQHLDLFVSELRETHESLQALK